MTIITLYGNIASGKTTLARKLIAQFPDLVYLSDDTIYTMFGNGRYRFGASPETFVLNAMRQMQVGAVAVNGLNVLIDIPAHTHERRRLFQMGGCDNVAIVTGWNSDPAFHADCRFKSDSRGTERDTWLKVATRLDSEREHPAKPWRTVPAGIVESRLVTLNGKYGCRTLEEVVEGP